MLNTEEALQSIGFQSTKVGGGDKERAYIIKQNQFLRIGLVVAAVLVILASILCFTVLDVKVQRRSTVFSKLAQRRMEHREHVELIEKQVKLQSILREEVNDADMIRDARATIGNLMTSYHDDLLNVLAKHPTAQKAVLGHNTKFQKFLKQLIDDLYKQARKEKAEAEAAMAQVGKNIAKEVGKDEEEEGEFKEEMTSLGEDANELEQQAKDAEAEGKPLGLDGLPLKESYKPDTPPPPPGEDEDGPMETEDVEKNVKRFYAKLQANKERYGHLSDEQFNSMLAFKRKMIEKMDGEADKFNKDELEAEADRHFEAMNLPKWRLNKKDYPEVTDYVEELMWFFGYKKYADEVDKLFDDMKVGTLTAAQVLAALEKISMKPLDADLSFPLHWLWAEEAGLKFEEDEEYNSAADPQDTEAAKLDEEAEGHADMPLADDADANQEADEEVGPKLDGTDAEDGAQVSAP